MVAKQSPYLRLIQHTGGTRHPGGLSLTDMLLKRIELKESSTILDVGCGAGHSAAHIAKTYGCKVVGVDISPEAVEKAHDFYHREPFFERLSFVVGDVAHLSFESNSFDVVLCESVLLFVEDKQAAIKEMARVVKRGGFLALNELCQSESSESGATKDYFARPEMGGFLVPATAYLDSLKDWRQVVMDERPFDIKAQFLADWHQWGNFKGLTQWLEAGFSLLTDKDLQNDLWQTLKLAKDMPRSIMQHLNHVLVLAQKP